MNYILITVLFAFSPLAFIPFLNVNGIPIFHLLWVLVASLMVVLSSTRANYDFNAKLLAYFLLFSIPALMISFYFSKGFSYIYMLLAYITFVFSKPLASAEFNKVLSYLLVSLLFLTTIGWLIRLGILHYTFLSDLAIESEYLLGYWGLRYSESTRNADYLFPLVGLLISVYNFVVKSRPRLMFVLVLLFSVTLLASLSRAAIIIVLINMIFVYRYSSRNYRYTFLVLLFLVFLASLEHIILLYDTVFSRILGSIFMLSSGDGTFSNAGRINITINALHAATLNPVGYGVDNYAFIYEFHKFPGRISNSGENAFLTFLVERGWLSTLFFLYIFIYNYRAAILMYKNTAVVSFNLIFIPSVFIYFLFNYELNNVFATMLILVLVVARRVMDYGK